MNVDTNGYAAYDYTTTEIPSNLSRHISNNYSDSIDTVKQQTGPIGISEDNQATSIPNDRNTPQYNKNLIHFDSKIRYHQPNIHPVPIHPNYSSQFVTGDNKNNNTGYPNNINSTTPDRIRNRNQNPETYSTLRARISPSNTYQYPSPLRTYNSEWIDSPQVSPSKLNHYYEMSTIQLQLQQQSQMHKHMIDTPLKQHNYSYITPISATKVSDITINEKHLEEDTSSVTSTEDSQILSKPEPLHNVKAWDILWDMINDVTGKDKFAKVSQYVLKLLLFHAERSQSYLSDNTFNIEVINARYNNKEKQLNLLRNFIRHPRDFLRTIAILVLSLFQSKLTGMANGLSSYRQFLRFGKSPFRVRGLYYKLKQNITFKDANIKINHPALFNRKTLGEVFGAYYSLADETSLLLKLKFYSNPTIKSLATRHEALAWYYDTWLNLYNAYEKSQLLAQQEIDLKIQIQVKTKAKILSKQLLGGHPLQINNKVSGKASREDLKLLNDIQFKKNNAYLDIYKNISDLIFNSYTVFNVALPFQTIQIWMGISASTFSTIKIYRETKKRLIEEEIKKRM